ncbi:hypothetical protein CDAR_575031 [Caerostris darwini]|uniref:Uncharacterized protein n=1 Tax=Caerostris darwini TaxID=1538125 RepID=A0AAV4T230_9ARAC|nr:hypothetical protein CDAR_575031 [Caerostris darwini]
MDFPPQRLISRFVPAFVFSPQEYFSRFPPSAANNQDTDHKEYFSRFPSFAANNRDTDHKVSGGHLWLHGKRVGIKGQKNVLKDVLSESIARKIIPEGLSWRWIYDFDTNRGVLLSGEATIDVDRGWLSKSWFRPTLFLGIFYPFINLAKGTAMSSCHGRRRVELNF